MTQAAAAISFGWLNTGVKGDNAVHAGGSSTHRTGPVALHQAEACL